MAARISLPRAAGHAGTGRQLHWTKSTGSEALQRGFKMQVRDTIKSTSTPVTDNKIGRFVTDLNARDIYLFIPTPWQQRFHLTSFIYVILLIGPPRSTDVVCASGRTFSSDWSGRRWFRQEQAILPAACRNYSGLSIAGHLSDPFI